MPSRRGNDPVGISGNNQRRRSKRKGLNYNTYIHKVLKEVHYGAGISGKAMEVMNSFMDDMFGRIAAEAARLARYSGKPTLSTREIQTAVKLLLPGDLGEHAISEGVKAVTKYSMSKNGCA